MMVRAREFRAYAMKRTGFNSDSLGNLDECPTHSRMLAGRFTWSAVRVHSALGATAAEARYCL